MKEKQTKAIINLSYDPKKINTNELENWIEEQLQKMQDCGEGLTGYSVRVMDEMDLLIKELGEYNNAMYERYCEEVLNSDLIKLLDDDQQMEFFKTFIAVRSREELIEEGWTTEKELKELGL